MRCRTAHESEQWNSFGEPTFPPASHMTLPYPFTNDESTELGVDLFTNDTEETLLQKTSWQKELEDLILDKDRAERAISGPSEILMGSPLPWPENFLEEIEKERLHAITEAQKVWCRMYGDNLRVLDLICDESEVDLRRALWRSDRVLEVEKSVLELFMLYDRGNYMGVVAMAAWLIPEHEKYGMWMSSQLLQLVRMSENRIFQNGTIVTCEGGVSSM